jgi:hypothetical protein
LRSRGGHIAQAEAGDPCIFHKDRDGEGSSCSLPPPGEVDLLMICPPCQPYSLFRDTKKKKPSEHRLFGATFSQTGSAVSMAEAVKPQVMILEQVLGFEKQDPGKQAMTYKQMLFDRILKIPGEVEGTSHFSAGVTLKVNSSIFSDSSRPRFSSCNVHTVSATLTHCPPGYVMDVWGCFCCFCVGHSSTLRRPWNCSGWPGHHAPGPWGSNARPRRGVRGGPSWGSRAA